jgi:hypothetical protein
MAFDPTKILIYIMAIAFGLLLGSFGTRKLQCTQVSIPRISFRDKDHTSDANLRNVHNANQSNTFLMKKHFSDAYIRSFPISSQHNLVVTAAVNLDLTTIYRFSRSMRASCAFCTLVMIVTNATMYNNDFRELADLYSIVYTSCEENFPLRLREHQSEIKYIHSSRWILIHIYLLNLEVKREVYDNVFICDSYDTLFQTDVFVHMNSYTPGLYVFIEDIRMTIGKCPYNHDWIKKCYGEAEVMKLFDKSISCSGTVLGTWSAILSYLSIMESEILTAPAACKSNVGSDQGVHNYIIHNSKINKVTIHHISHEYGFVGTLGYALWLKRNQFGLVQNANRSVYAVIHQWNRSEQMKAQFQREYQIIPPDTRDKKN